ncbi:nucleobase-ascorbate transporter 6-like isoform X2 [Olea europaea var. sylvestris]|uniref:Nucleobase-ascorbate transporter 6 n=1 Tax=Olea europaea subsp. europaea TaxID=158383 RepID=A0A8S0RUJ4_OLEEU|nr:nucleobase-ascorbate transporter 6-like isoform X1 [Olea europaea var. sylvestris]XP_022845112.1 nucleobase-ascorbate transporter 6-like isoform X1 [Olea europaea var. sylvestris]XP_022845113.1 nucleobase-ascorbate transporter 6-like isoform X1 [Olea europaea var. sylvestris]XP_022845114.1 nucleobase-ascorbate transporter 6-like isoform X2 [Olea europaea var. sylvestris]CAA2983651.1 nucleobase-ascorbate transporter 6 [Olea europaea subsp. europaea]
MAPIVVKPDDPPPHTPKDQLPNVFYCITSPPPWPEAILLGFQHYIVMLGTTVIIPTALVPQMGGGNEEKAKVIQTLLFVAGLNTLLQSVVGTRLPVVMGGSYTFVAPTLSIILSGRWSDPDPVSKFKKIMRATQGALIVASTIQIVLGFSGLWRNVARYLSPISAVPLATLAGFGLYEFGFPGVGKCVEIGLPQLVIVIFISQYLVNLISPGKHIFERFSVLITVAIVWIYAHLLTVGGAYNGKAPKTQTSCRTDRAGLIDAAPWIRVPYPFQWGAPSFDAGEAFAMMMAAFVSLVESCGAFISVSRLASATPLPPSIFGRGIGWQGVAILLSGLFGTGNGSSVAVENVGLIGLTRVGSRRAVQISAGFMIFFSVLGKFGAVFASIPAPIFAALYCVFFAYVGTGGLAFLQFCQLNSFRNTFILGFPIFMGLSVPQYFNEYTAIKGYGPAHTTGRWFNDLINVPFSSGAFIAGILAYFLDNTLEKKDPQVRKDRGRHWWDRFHSFKSDPRSVEFYSLPFNLNKYFPSA